MQANFGRHGLSSFEDFAHFSIAFEMAKFPFQTMGYNNLVGSKNRIMQLKKFKQVEVVVKCMQTNFGVHGHSGLRDLLIFVCLQNGQIALLDHGYSPWGSKNRIGS